MAVFLFANVVLWHSPGPQSPPRSRLTSVINDDGPAVSEPVAGCLENGALRRIEIMIVACEQYRGFDESTVEHRPADDAVVVTDGGVATENPTQDDDETLITGPHLESPEQGGATYNRCEDCGRESLRHEDGEHSEFHAEECTLR